jgi:hypothetical protein
LVNGVDDLLALWGPDRVLELLDEAELPATKSAEPTQAQMLVELAEDAELFHSPDGEAYVRLPVDDHSENWLVKGRGCRRWLVRRFYQTYRKPPGSQALQDALGLLEARAQFDSPEFLVFTRVASHGNCIYIDLANDKWESVEITPEGWRVVPDPPVRFRRAKGMLPLPHPAGGGSIELLRKFINITAESDWVLCASWLVAACRPSGPYPILIFQGEQGSAKSTSEKLLRRVIDPSAALVRTPPRDDRDLLIAATNSWVVALDNLSGVRPWLSDALCRLATGGGYTTRELYTDAEEVFFDAMRPVTLNGIDHLAERADLADRALIVNLPRIDDEQRKDEKQLYTEFEAELPQILGALFDAVAAALKQLPETKLDRMPRMADFALWATAAEQALGFEEGRFLNAYTGNRAEAIEATLEADLVSTAILALMEGTGEEGKNEQWEGTCVELKQRLEEIDEYASKSRSWPKTPRGMSSRLRRLVTYLREVGITITFHRKSHGRRLLTIARTGSDLTAPSDPTAPQGRHAQLGQQAETYNGGGGSASAVANGQNQRYQPPPAESPAIPLAGGERPSSGCDWGAGGGSMRPDANSGQEEGWI